MRDGLAKLVHAYAMIGVVLASAMWTSYLWSTTWGAPSDLSFTQRLALTASVQKAAFPQCALHAIVWGPSLVVWMISPQGYSFAKWLAPGFYADAVEVPAKR